MKANHPVYHFKGLCVLAALFFFLGGHHVKAQVEVDMTMTVEELVQNVLLGNGVAVSNITFNGQPATINHNQIAKFSGSSNVVSFPAGLMLATQDAESFVTAGGEIGDNLTNDPDLMALSGQNMNNCAILEFDFVPNGDSLEFRYVFASNEYPSYTCSGFNDAFGFFISGPGITGPFTNQAENIALIPNSNTPVAINTVNSGSASGSYDAQTCANANPNWVEDSQYFVENDPPAEGDIQVPGMTTTLTAYANVICGETYHIKIAIGNASDQILHSGVFLESESFSSNSTVQVQLDIPVGVNDSTLYEGCGTATLQFIRPSASQAIQETAYLDIGGTAVNGVDYIPALPDSVVFPDGVDTVTYVVSAPYDGVVEGLETVHIVITNIASDCSGQELTSEFTFYIREPDPLEVTGFDGELMDCNDDIELYPTVTGGYGEYSYSWTTGSTADTITVSPGFTTTYFVTVSDTCGVSPVVTSFHVDVPVYPPVNVTLPPDTVVEVCDVTVPIAAQTTGGFGQYHYKWYHDGTLISQQSSINFFVEQSSEIVLVVHDDCGALASDTMLVSLEDVELTTFLPDGYVSNSCMETIMLPVIAEGGIGDLTFFWSVDGVPQDTSHNLYFNYHPSMGQNVVVKTKDYCNNIRTDSTFIEFQFPEVGLKTTADTSICVGGTAVLHAQAVGGSGNFKYTWNSAPDSTTTLTVRPSTDRNYYVQVTDTCGMTAQEMIHVRIREVVADFDYEYVDYYGLKLTNYSRGEDLQYLWDFGDGVRSNEKNPVHHYGGLNKYRVVLTAMDPVGCSAKATLMTEPPSELFIPNAFTPNGDGYNDSFGIVAENVTEFQIWIYDRFGNQVFYSDDPDMRWNGSYEGSEYYSSSSVYNYRIRYKGELKEDAVEITGFVTLIR